jgi:hypothetical protein
VRKLHEVKGLEKLDVELALPLRNAVVIIDSIPYKVFCHHAAATVCGLWEFNNSLSYISPQFEFLNSMVTVESFKTITSQQDFNVSKFILTADYTPYASMPKSILIVLTTCNQLNMTVLALDYLKGAFIEGDLIIVDDHSIDGTPDYLIKRGYTVITKDHAKGLTDSWNRGYEFANRMKYKYVIFTNNDVLLTATTVKIMKEDLKHEALVGPLTTPNGAGHNPLQVFFLFF